MNSLPLLFDNTTYTVFGGPYRHKPKGMFGVKMAQEIAASYDVNCPAADFCAPDREDFARAVAQTLSLILTGKPVYVGCMGGIGRTGAMMAALAKISLYRQEQKDFYDAPPEDPIQYVRRLYDPHAVEVEAQERLIRELDVGRYIPFIDAMLAARPVEAPIPGFWRRVRDALGWF